MTAKGGDWEPLVPEQVAAHPGEAAPAAPSTPAAKTTVASLSSHVQMRLRPPRIYERLRLKALQQMLQGKSLDAKDSFDAALNQSLRREERQEQAQQAEFAATAVHATSSLQGPQDVPLQPDYAKGRDHREDEPWFHALPAQEQERLHQAWLTERQRFAGLPAARRRERYGRFGAAFMVFFLVGLPQALFLGLGHFVAMAIGGVVLGAVWQFCRLERFWCAVSSGGVYLASILVPAMHRGFDTVSTIWLMFGLGAVAWIGALAGFSREIERSGGFRRES